MYIYIYILYIYIYIYIYIYDIYMIICIYRNKIVRKLDDNENSVFKYRFKNRFLIVIHFSHLLLYIKLSLRVLKNLLLYIYIYIYIKYVKNRVVSIVV